MPIRRRPTAGTARPPSDANASAIDVDSADQLAPRAREAALQADIAALTEANSQLQATLERQRTVSNDLQNVLYSTNVATIFLDTELNIRLFTPATRLLFNVMPSDVGRPLADLSSLAADSALLADVRIVLINNEPFDREIEAKTGAWYIRRILPYRTQGDRVEGVVITFVDISERREAAEAVQAAKRLAEQANDAKSRFLAAASHDLRQPLQTLALVQGLLAKTVEGDRAKRLVARLDDTLGAMAGMLNALLDINQIEAGAVRPEPVSFPINNLLDRMKGEFAYQAESQRLALHVVPCGLWIRSDPRLLEQMMRNLISNALKYTRRGKVLIGCRRRRGALVLEVWDTGVGIASGDLPAVFEEFHQLDNAARERSRGLGLGLSIVSRLGRLLDHVVDVRSTPGKGSMFSIEIAIPEGERAPPALVRELAVHAPAMGRRRRSGAILVVEDDPELREMLEYALKQDGHRVVAVSDGPTALDVAAAGGIDPDLILADFNLPNGMNGLQVVSTLREQLDHEIPVVILTGDISTGTLRAIAAENCVHFNKPAKLVDICKVVQQRLPATSRTASPARAAGVSADAVIYVVDDDFHLRETIREVLEGEGRTVEDFADSEAFLAAYRPGPRACLLIDANLPGMSGIDLLQRLKDEGRHLPAVMITGQSDVPMAVQAMKAGAADFVEKPISATDLVASIDRALEQARDFGKVTAWRESAVTHMEALTPRQRQIMDMVLAGHPSKNIAADLGISQRTVENHRASIMKRTGSKSLPALARLAVAAAWDDRDLQAGD